ncbi:hypothetical protein NKDENANG_00180 [Candidatus Entotheonellaceae bacterium PAL068K]
MADTQTMHNSDELGGIPPVNRWVNNPPMYTRLANTNMP